MKKFFAVGSVAVWTLDLIIGIGFAVLGEISATNSLPLENRQLLTEIYSLASERDSLLELVKIENGRRNQYEAVLGLQNEMLFASGTHLSVKSWGPRPRED